MEESSDDELVWENVQDENEELDVQHVEKENVVVEIDWDLLANPKKVRRKPLSKAEKQDIMYQHQLELVCLVARESAVVKSVSNVHIGSLVLSIVPHDIVSKIQKHAVTGSLRLMEFWYQEFEIIQESGTDAMDLYRRQDIEKVLKRKSGLAYQMVAMFAAVLFVLQVPARYVATLDPRRLRFPAGRENVLIQYFGTDPEQIAMMMVQRHKGTEKPSKKKARKSIHGNVRVWIEIENADHTYTLLNPVENKVLKKHDIEASRAQGKTLAYAVAWLKNGVRSDVTMRYATNWSKSKRKRLSGQALHWWYGLVLQQSATENTKAACEIVPSVVHAQPKTLHEFRTSEHYCLEKHLRKFEMIHPKKPVGLFNGVGVYKRDQVHTLHTKKGWRKLGKVVTTDTPAKQVAMSNKKNTEYYALYGEWQTEPYIPPPIINGKLPMNDHGNYQVYSPACIPSGAMHITEPDNIHKIAKLHKIHHVRALVDWENQLGRNVPIFNGILITLESKPHLDDCLAQYKQEEIKLAKLERKRKALKNWTIFVQKYTIRKRLVEDYGTF